MGEIMKKIDLSRDSFPCTQEAENDVDILEAFLVFDKDGNGVISAGDSLDKLCDDLKVLLIR